MIRGTTPTDTIRIKNPGDLDLTTVDEVYVTIRQGVYTITKTGEDIEVAKAAVSYSLTQQESLRFKVGEAEAQINWIYTNNEGRKRAATKWLTIMIDKQLLERVI